MLQSRRPRVLIISPALKAANNGNWQTAYRWAGFLAANYAVSIDTDWDGRADLAPQCLIALHARRSALPLARFAERYPQRPTVLVLTGTDLYRDIRSDTMAGKSLRIARSLVVLQDKGLDELDAAARTKCFVIYQSARTLKPAQPNRRTFDIVMVGHLRAEKDPLTPMRALERIARDQPIRLAHIGDALDTKLGHAAKALAARDARYCWLGQLPHAETRQRIKNSRLLVNSSLIEGGANAVIEAVTSGVPVLASHIPGNLGMLGEDYSGYFPAGDTAALAKLIGRTMNDANFLRELRRQCARRAHLFRPLRERKEVITLVRSLLGSNPETHS